MCLRIFKSGYLIVFWSAAGVYLILSVGDLILVFGSFETQNIYQIRNLLSSKYVQKLITYRLKSLRSTNPGTNVCI